jgi:hypothetical protein
VAARRLLHKEPIDAGQKRLKLGDDEEGNPWRWKEVNFMATGSFVRCLASVLRATSSGSAVKLNCCASCIFC